MINMLTCWILALTAYGAYAAIAFNDTDTATKAWVAMSFATFSLIMWVILNHNHHGRNKK